jgi:hypothetical protein
VRWRKNSKGECLGYWSAHLITGRKITPSRTINSYLPAFKHLSVAFIVGNRKYRKIVNGNKSRTVCASVGILGFHMTSQKWRGGGATLKQNTVIRVSRLFVLCVSLVFGGKYVEFRIIISLQYSISINTFEVDPPSDSLHNAVVKPNNIVSRPSELTSRRCSKRRSSPIF